MSGTYEVTRIGDMTLCKFCNRAIRLERTQFYGDCWMHFTPDIWRTHTASPKRSMWAHLASADCSSAVSAQPMNTGGSDE